MKKFGRAGSTFGTVVAAAALLAVATTGGAVAGGLVTSAKIKNNTIKSIDVRDNNLTGVDVADGSLGSTDVADGSLLPQDASSDTQRRFTSINGFAVVTADSPTVANGADGNVRAVCPAGTRVLGGGAAWAGGVAGASFLSRNAPDAYSGGTSSNPTTTTANAWYGQGENHSGGSLIMRAYAICATVY